MSQPQSPAETRLETQRLGPLQIRVALLCMLAQIFDGYDISSIGVAVPALIKDWHLPGPAFANTFVMSSIGIMIGALSSGPIGDRIGRKPVLIASLAVLGLSSLACTRVGSVSDLVMLRLITGLGIGMLLPATVALSSDYLPDRLRAGGVMIVFTGAPLGGFAGGMFGLAPAADVRLAGHFVDRRHPAFGAGPDRPRLAAGIAAVPAGAWPPERQHRETDAPAWHQSRHAGGHHVDVARGNPVAGLFRDGLTATTILIWIMFFCNLLSMYFIGYWMPTVLSLSGLTPADAVFASALRDAGPLLSVFAIAPLATRFGAPAVVRVTLFMGIIFIGLVGLVAMPDLVLLAVIFLVAAAWSAARPD